jgi:hypothetical protein
VALLSNVREKTDIEISLYKPNATVFGRNWNSRLPWVEYYLSAMSVFLGTKPAKLSELRDFPRGAFQKSVLLL